MFSSYPGLHSIIFRHPDTGARIGWHGAEGIAPIMIDVVDSVAYMVVFPFSIRASLRDYNCPYPPYAFLRHDGGLKGWTVITSEYLPAVLKRANVEIRNSERRQIDSQFRYQVEFPRDVNSWRYPKKFDRSPHLDRYGC